SFHFMNFSKSVKRFNLFIVVTNPNTDSYKTHRCSSVVNSSPPPLLMSRLADDNPCRNHPARWRPTPSQG
ncbi:MAG TPA: hypothetical protein PLX69_18685, partial [Leptospiraceae bacterium]|nr:hypothetical protein [Leptospiraceae bacterium]